MHKGLVLLALTLVVLCTFSTTAEAGGLSRHKESNKIVDLLEAILAKFGKGRKENESYINKIGDDLETAEKEVVTARKLYKKEMAEATQTKENSASEERLIRKILAMLKSDVGEHKNHVAMSCKEVMKDETNKDGYYFVNVNGQAKKVYCARQEGRTMFSGSCNAASKGNGWATQCLNEVEFNEAEEYLNAKSDGTIIVKVAGVYRITGKSNMFSESTRNHFGRILINGKTKQYSYHNANQNTAEHIALYFPLKKNDKITVVWYINAGSKSERFPASKGDGSNRVQVDYIGEFDKVPVFSAGCEGHRTGHAWGKNCFSGRNWAPASIQEKTFTAESSGDIIAKESGYYHIQATNMMHATNSYSHCEIKIGGTRRTYLYNYDISWRMMHADLTYWVNAGQKIEVLWKVDGGSPYARHSQSGDNGYNRLQVLYLGNKEAVAPYQYVGYCSSHSRSKSWATYCLNKSWRNDLSKQLSVASNGIVTVKVSGFYRIAAHAIVHRARAENAFSRILVDSETVDSNTVYQNAAWTEMYHDVTLPLNKGQKVQIQYMASHYAFHAGPTHSLVQIMYVDRK